MEKTDKLELAAAEAKVSPSLAVVLCDIPVTHEAGEDFTLPDYIPGVRRILSVWVRVLPENGFLSGDVLEFGGTAVFGVTYADEDGAIRFVPLTSTYSADARLPEGCPAADRISIDTRADSPTCRVLGPRRLSLRTKLKSRLLAFGEAKSTAALTDTTGGALSGADEISIERLKMTVPSFTRGISRVTGEAGGEWRMRSGTKPVSCDGAVAVTDVSESDGMMRIVGELAMKCLCEGEDGSYSSCRIRIPFENTTDAGGITPGSRMRASGKCASVTLTPDETESGLYTCAVEYDLACEWMTECPCTLTEDLYSSQYPSTLRMAETETAVPLRCAVGQLSVSGTSPSGITEGEYLADIDAAAVCTKCERQTDGRLLLSGEMTVRAVMAGGEEKRGEEFTVPFRYEVMPDMSGASSGTDAGLLWQCDVTVTDVSARIDSGKPQANAELCISLSAVSKRRVKYVGEAQLDKSAPYLSGDPEVCVYYTTDGDRLWDIGKRYKRHCADIVRANKISGDALPAAVIIP